MIYFRSELTFSERVNMTWQLVWPTVAAQFAWGFTVYVLLGVTSQNAELVFFVPYLLVIAPWLVRRMVRRRYEGFRLKTLVEGTEAPLGFTESFKVMWLLNWRTSVLILGLLLVVSFFGQFLSVQLSTLVPTAQQAPFVNSMGVSLLENAGAMILMPLVMPGMFRKRYQGFRMAVERNAKPKPKAGTKARSALLL